MPCGWDEQSSGGHEWKDAHGGLVAPGGSVGGHVKDRRLSKACNQEALVC